jgi:hypothetical protein
VFGTATASSLMRECDRRIVPMQRNGAASSSIVKSKQSLPDVQDSATILSFSFDFEAMRRVRRNTVKLAITH